MVSCVSCQFAENYPSCNSSSNSSTYRDGYVVENDFIFLLCSFNYSGNVRPIMKWIREGHETSLNDTFHPSSILNSSSLYRATSSVVVQVDRDTKDLSYACVASFSTFGHPESATSFSEVPYGHYQCNLTIIVACMFLTQILRCTYFRSFIRKSVT